MFSRIWILHYDIDNIHGFQNKARRAVSCCHGRIRTETEFGEDSWNKRRVVRDLVEHCVVRAIVHGGEADHEFNGLCNGWLSDHKRGDQRSVIHVMVFIDKAEIG